MRQQSDDCGPLPSWDDESACGGQFDDGNAYSDVEEPNTLVSQPRQVGYGLYSWSVSDLVFAYFHESNVKG